MEQNGTEPKIEETVQVAPANAAPAEVEVLEVEDDLDTGMHRVNVCKAY